MTGHFDDTLLVRDVVPHPSDIEQARGVRPKP